MNKKNIIIIGIVILLALVAGAAFLTMRQDSTANPDQEVLGEPAVIITRTNNGYEPKEVTIKQGDVVLWVNESDDFHWPASDLHPTHGVYPAFDPLRPLAPGEDWKFKFDQAGVWRFHDHIRANETGTVTVTN